MNNFLPSNRDESDIVEDWEDEDDNGEDVDEDLSGDEQDDDEEEEDMSEDDSEDEDEDESDGASDTGDDEEQMDEDDDEEVEDDDDDEEATPTCRTISESSTLKQESPSAPLFAPRPEKTKPKQKSKSKAKAKSGVSAEAGKTSGFPDFPPRPRQTKILDGHGVVLLKKPVPVHASPSSGAAGKKKKERSENVAASSSLAAAGKKRKDRGEENGAFKAVSPLKKAKVAASTLVAPAAPEVAYGSVVVCVTSGTLPEGNGRNKQMVVTGGNLRDSVITLPQRGTGKQEKPTDSDVKTAIAKLGKTFAHLVQVSHLLPVVHQHDPKDSRNKGAVLQGFLVRRKISSRSDTLKNVHWYFFPLNPTNEHKIYRKEYADGDRQDKQIQAKYSEIIRDNNIRQSNGPLTIEFPKDTGKMWTFDHRWFSSSGFKHVKDQNQRPAPSSAPRTSKPKPAPARAPAEPAAPSAVAPGVEPVQAPLATEDIKKILANQEKILRFLSAFKFPTGL